MTISKQVKRLCDQENNLDADNNSVSQQRITEVTTNTFVINLQQAIFGLETGSVMKDVIMDKDLGDKPSFSLKKTRHFITGTELSKEELLLILYKAKVIKQNPELYCQALVNKSLAMIFEKASFRTRLNSLLLSCPSYPKHRRCDSHFAIKY